MIGTRIKLARKKAGLSLRGLAEALEGKVTAQAIGKYERDEMTPSSGVLLALSKALGVSLAYLMDTQGIELTSVDFRTKANTTGKDRAHVETEVIEWIERYLQIEHILELNSAEWETPIDPPRRLSVVEEAEALADDVREQWNLGRDQIPNMTELLEEKGLKVLIQELPERVSGFTCMVRRRGNLPELPVIVVNQRFPLERRRLTLAHELAHRVIDPEGLTEQEEEKAATYFAGAFLMPRDHLMREVGKRRDHLSYREIIHLKRLYRVSGAALLVRLKNIGIISESTLTYAFQSIARGWRTSEPEELETERGSWERPRRFERLCYRALAEGLISLTKAAELLRQPIEEVEAELKGPA
ncbi:XRE family transcriptional regulator [Methylocaldum sp. RMAD-M]|jgi:Zn-dependent peptidase ImmA (M78 family)/DNA-binding XRE family transcriptional regulator|uniref:helix-turn-helix domain-containing protein n=1 Tax=Methylocaldum sp. RMAD-M TaxID=2806557 RepID=UPI001AE31823|nr:XRE family transcriptional regulator [Methylocaldum sp. RMAD-M]MBP1151798.1 Zn-dependent peptidase ImmA (M78 family)/DNA-binding XRE family transcriptional regulator [Methylocaldum sp. RMAD-M]